MGVNNNFSIAGLAAKLVFQKNHQEDQPAIEKKIQHLIQALEFENALIVLKEHKFSIDAKGYDSLINELFSKWLDANSSNAYKALALETLREAQATHSLPISTLSNEPLQTFSINQETEEGKEAEEKIESSSESSHELEKLKNSDQNRAISELLEESPAPEDGMFISNAGQQPPSDEPPRSRDFKLTLIENYFL